MVQVKKKTDFTLKKAQSVLTILENNNNKKSQSSRKKNSLLILEDEKENVEYVSPYTIKNETGYSIEIERDDSLHNNLFIQKKKNIRKYLLPNGASMNFQIESELDSIFFQVNENKSKFKKKN